MVGNRYAYLPCRMCYQRSAGPCARVRPTSHFNTSAGTRACISHTLAISLIGLTLHFGFPMLSTNMALVFSSIAAAKAEGSSEVTNLVEMPYFFKNTIQTVSSGHIYMFIYERINLPLN